MIEQFRDIFGSADGVRVFRAPGRVNLIGEHTDYNMGFVMPMALQLETRVAAAPGSNGKIRIYSEHQKEMHQWDAADVASFTRAGRWSDYPAGVARELDRAGFGILPVDMLIRSTVPEGSGLSSSAALEVSTALAFLWGRPIAGLELAKLCQRAEVEFVGVPCGIMDQYIAIHGRAGAAIQIDCRSLERRETPLPSGAQFIAINSMVKHALGSSAYRERVKECAAAVEFLRGRYPEVDTLRDVTLVAFEDSAGQMPEVIMRRARHVISENGRVQSFAELSTEGDLEGMGNLMTESHRSLRDDYEVSCGELDFLVDTALGIEGVYGSRMTGGGFGGCTVSLVSQSLAEKFEREMIAAYEAKFRITPMVYQCRASAGAGEIKIFPEK